MSKTNLSKGREMRRKLLGDAYVDNMAATTYKDPRMQKFVDLASETVFGTLWTRPGLDLKTRTLITVISDASTGSEPELAIHLRMARRQGWTEDELTEAILHLLGYVGAPLVHDRASRDEDVHGFARGGERPGYRRAVADETRADRYVLVRLGLGTDCGNKNKWGSE